MEAREGQSAEGFDHIEWEQQNLFLTLRVQLTSTPTPTEPFGEVIHQYTNTLCTTQKQTNLKNSPLWDQGSYNFWKSGKSGKNMRCFPVREKSGNFKIY